jgi:hypothetical protein
MPGCQPCAPADDVFIVSVRVLEYLCCLCGRHVAWKHVVSTNNKRVNDLVTLMDNKEQILSVTTEVVLSGLICKCRVETFFKIWHLFV